MTIRFSLSLLALLALGGASSCIDLTPDAPPPVRWLSLMPEAPQPGTNKRGTTTPEPVQPALRVGAVTGTDAISDLFTTRISPVEITYSDFVRWAESPVVTVERALLEELFQRSGFVRDDRAERRLDLQLIAFEVRLDPRREARVAVIASLFDGAGRTLVNKRFESSMPVDGEDPALAAEVLGAATARVVADVAELISLR